jgi:predicted metal-dependent peptidase
MNEGSLKSVSQVQGRRQWYNDNFTDKQAYNSVCTAKTRLLLKHPFWGFMGLDLVLVEAPTAIVDTLGTDGYHIFYSPAFINQLTMEEIEFGIAHEIYHCIFGHTSGKGKVQRKHADWDAKIWNKACDHVINYDLVDSKIGETTIVGGLHHIGPIQICYNKKYADMSSEEVYFDLVKNADNDDGSKTLDTHIDFDTSGGEGDGGDKDSDKDDKASSDAAGASVSKDGSGNIRIPMKPSEYAAEKVRWQTMAEQAASNVMQTSQGAGSIPAHLKKLIGDLHKPKIKWPVKLRKFVTKIRSTGYNWSMPSKRSYGHAFMPSFRSQKDKLTIAIAFDTSGSVGSAQLNKFISEFLGIMKSYSSYTIHAFCFEGSVDEATYMCIDSFDGTAEKNLQAYAEHVKGGGGTNFQSVWNFLKKKKIKPRGLLVFTDGYPCDQTWHRERNYCPSMFITVGNHDGWKSPFGITCQYEDA